MQKREITIVWYRNDLRLHDNLVLQKAVASGFPIVAIYSLEPRFFKTSVLTYLKLGDHRYNFLIEALSELKNNLGDFNIPLLVSDLSPENCLEKLNSEYEIKHLYYQSDWTHEELEVEQNVITKADKLHIKRHSFYNQFLFNPYDIIKLCNTIPDSFSSFRKKVEKKAIVPARCSVSLKKQAPLNINKLDCIELCNKELEQNLNSAFPFKGGENQSIERLNNYIFETKKIGYYKKTRNGLLGVDYSSKFSPWLALGCLSPRTIYWSVKDFESKEFANQSTYWLIFELLWREFFKFSSMKHKNRFFSIGGIQKKKSSNQTDVNILTNWIDGKTKDDFVNANMLELKHTGWMSNRGRQNVASYLVHNLNLDWRLGAAYFESMLIDYDVHSNYGNWMYVAGVGSTKNVKVFNTKQQAEWYDASKKFQKLWLQPTLF